MAGERDKEIGDETRNQMMQNLFGDQSEEEEEEEGDEGVIDNRHSEYPPSEEDDAEMEGEGEIDINEGQGEVEVEESLLNNNLNGILRHQHSDVGDDDQGEESEAERAQTYPEREIHHRMGSQGNDVVQSAGEEDEDEDEDEDDDDDQGGAYGQRVVTSKRRDVFSSESEERSKGNNHYVQTGIDEEEEEEEDEVDQDRKPISSSEGGDIAAIRDVFGDSDDEDVPAEYEVQNEVADEDDIYEKNLKPEEILLNEDDQYESDDENLDQKSKERVMGPPIDLGIPLHRPPEQSDKMNMIKVSNIMGIEPKPFDPKTYVEEDAFVTDESGMRKRIRLEDNIVRSRRVRNRDGTFSIESNARFVKWSDGSLQLLIGNEVLNLNVQEAQHDHTHLFLRHEKGIIQSQGRLLRKMRFMPSSLTSKSHRLLTAIVDSRHKKVYKVKNCITDIDPEREKEEKEKAEGQSIKENVLLQRKREKVGRKYTQSSDRGRQLSPGFLEEALDEDDEHEDYYSTRRSAARRRFEEDMEIESHAERRIINAKKTPRDTRRGSLSSGLRARSRLHDDYSDNDQEESEYESDGDEGNVNKIYSDHEDEYEEEDDEDEVRGVNAASEDDEEEIRPRNKDISSNSRRKRKEVASDAEESPLRKNTTHRRFKMAFDSDDD